jgi:hypothetical protein
MSVVGWQPPIVKRELTTARRQGDVGTQVTALDDAPIPAAATITDLKQQRRLSALEA